jgi:hypothetical protein
MADTTQSDMPKLFHFAIYRPGNDPKAPSIKAPVGSCRFLLTTKEEHALFGPLARAKAEEIAEKIKKIMPGTWEIKITEVPFMVTRGTPKVVGRCSLTSCKNYNVPVDNVFFCGICGEPLQLTWEGTAE